MHTHLASTFSRFVFPLSSPRQNQLPTSSYLMCHFPKPHHCHLWKLSLEIYTLLLGKLLPVGHNMTQVKPIRCHPSSSLKGRSCRVMQYMNNSFARQGVHFESRCIPSGFVIQQDLGRKLAQNIMLPPQLATSILFKGARLTLIHLVFKSESYWYSS